MRCHNSRGERFIKESGKSNLTFLWPLICILSFLFLVFILRQALRHSDLPRSYSGATVCSYTYDQIAHELEPYGFNGLGKIGDARSINADGLIIRGVDGNRPGGSAWIVKNGVVRKVYSPNGVPYVDQSGNMFGWGTTNMVFIASGSRFAVQFMRQYVALDPDGKFVLVTENTGGDSWRSWIQATNQGDKELWVCNDAECESLARAGGKLFVLGRANPGVPVCFVLDETDRTLTEERRLDIDSGYIQDVDPSGKYLLILRDGPFSSLSIYNILSGTEERCRVFPEYWSFFLKSDPFVGRK